MDKLDIPQGTLDLMILTILAREPMHGYGISQRLAVLSHDTVPRQSGIAVPLAVPSGAGRQAESRWRPRKTIETPSTTELTAVRRRQLEQHRERWDRVAFAITSVLEGA